MEPTTLLMQTVMAIVKPFVQKGVEIILKIKRDN